MSEKSNKEQKEQIVKQEYRKDCKRKLVKKRSRYIPRRIKEDLPRIMTDSCWLI